VLEDIVLCRTLNHKIIQLGHDTHNETVGVRRKDGSYQYLRWLGFLSRSDALDLGAPVKLSILRIGHGKTFDLQWTELKKEQHVQGCATYNGAYAVVDVDVRVV